MAQGKFDVWQQTFTLSMMANGDYHVNASIQGGLAKHLESSINERFAYPKLQELVGDSWQLAWGPCVYQNSASRCADNAMFVAHDTINNLYVVAIAATNIDSVHDLFVEDIHMRPVAWPYGGSAPNGTKIAQGTQDGVNALLSMKSQGQTLLAYLQARTDASTSTLIFTGHSLGGALAPTLALALKGQGLNLKAWKAVYVYPTAGPTPGNAAFATYFSQTFPQSATGPRPWQVWNADLANSLDVVPCAWSERTLSSIPHLYAPNVTASFMIETIVLAAKGLVLFHSYTRIGTANDLTGSRVQGSGDTFKAFLDEALYQHIQAYFGLLGVGDLPPILHATDPSAPAPPRMASA